MKKILNLSFMVLLSLFLFGCLPSEYNLRTIYEPDRNYISADSTSYNMKWNTQSWVNKNVKYWSSAGLIITNTYNIFEENQWLIETVNNGFEGQIIVQLRPDIIYEDWGSASENSFKKDFYDMQTSEDVTLKLISNSEDVVISDPTDGNYRLIKPNVTEAYLDSLGTVLNDHFSSLDSTLGLSDNITYGMYFPEYNYRYFNGYSVIDDTDVDPADLGYSLDSYSNEDYDLSIHSFYDNIITRFKVIGIPTIISGDRTSYDRDLITSFDISGYLFSEVNETNIDSIISYADTLRNYIEPDQVENSLLFVAGIKTNQYNMNVTSYAKMIEKIINAGMYFTPGGFNDYFQYPNYKIGNWWIRNNDDSNWVNHNKNPEYTSTKNTPRKLINRAGDSTAPNILTFAVSIDTTVTQ